jgi:hypothetical protein
MRPTAREMADKIEDILRSTVEEMRIDPDVGLCLMIFSCLASVCSGAGQPRAANCFLRTQTWCIKVYNVVMGE